MSKGLDPQTVTTVYRMIGQYYLGVVDHRAWQLIHDVSAPKLSIRNWKHILMRSHIFCHWQAEEMLKKIPDIPQVENCLLYKSQILWQRGEFENAMKLADSALHTYAPPQMVQNLSD